MPSYDHHARCCAQMYPLLYSARRSTLMGSLFPLGRLSLWICSLGPLLTWVRNFHLLPWLEYCALLMDGHSFDSIFCLFLACLSWALVNHMVTWRWWCVFWKPELGRTNVRSQVGYRNQKRECQLYSWFFFCTAELALPVSILPVIARLLLGYSRSAGEKPP